MCISSEVFANIQALTAPCALTKQRAQNMFSSSLSLFGWSGWDRVFFRVKAEVELAFNLVRATCVTHIVRQRHIQNNTFIFHVVVTRSVWSVSPHAHACVPPVYLSP